MFDLMTTAAIVDELSSRLVGGRVQSAGLRDRETLVLEVYAQHERLNLLAAIGGREPACYISSAEMRPDPEIVTPFSLLIRKYLRGAMVVAVSQPPLDRVIQISFAKLIGGTTSEGDGEDEAEPAGELVHTALSIEMMGRRSNVILIDDNGVVLESLKRVTSRMSSVRPVLPQRSFTLPPPADRLDPRALTTVDLVRALEERRTGEELTNWIVRTVSGLSPQMAREICFRATGTLRADAEHVDESTVRQLAIETRLMMRAISEGDWTPASYKTSTGSIEAYAALEMSHLLAESGLTSEPRTSISAVVEEFRGPGQQSDRHAGRRERLLRQIESEQRRARTKLRALEKELEAADDGDRFRRWGEAIFANLWTIDAGQPVLAWEGESIPLDPPRAASQVAQEYFALYRKAGRGRDQLAPLIATAVAERDYLDQLHALTSIAEAFDDIEALRAEWAALPSSQKQQKGENVRTSRNAASPKPIRDSEGNSIYIGRSGRENERVTFDIATPQDFWLHARGAPGAHVILRPEQPGGPVSDTAFERAASIAAYFSTMRESGAVEVDICRRSDVRKIKGAGPGMVTYRNERTVRVTPRHIEAALEFQ